MQTIYKFNGPCEIGTEITDFGMTFAKTFNNKILVPVGILLQAYRSNNGKNPIAENIMANRYKGELVNNMLHIIGKGSESDHKNAQIIVYPRHAVENGNLVGKGGKVVSYNCPPDGYIEEYNEYGFPVSTSKNKTLLTKKNSDDSYFTRRESQGFSWVIRRFKWGYNGGGPFGLYAVWDNPGGGDGDVGSRLFSALPEVAEQIVLPGNGKIK